MRQLHMAAVLALAAAHLPTRDEVRKDRGRSIDSGMAVPQTPPSDAEVERIKAELRERRRQNFLRRPQ